LFFVRIDESMMNQKQIEIIVVGIVFDVCFVVINALNVFEPLSRAFDGLKFYVGSHKVDDDVLFEIVVELDHSIVIVDGLWLVSLFNHS
jgi:hypothetical protein